jgi:hypothetical protein
MKLLLIIFLLLSSCATTNSYLNLDCSNEKRQVIAEINECNKLCPDKGDICCPILSCDLPSFRKWKRETRAICNYYWNPSWPNIDADAETKCFLESVDVNNQN